MWKSDFASFFQTPSVYNFFLFFIIIIFFNRNALFKELKNLSH